MIHLKSSAVLYINKISILLVSLMLLLLWVNFEFTKPTQQHITQNNSANTDSNNQTSGSKYLKILSVNPFLRSHEESESNDLNEDILPTVTALQSTIPAFASLELRLHGIVYQSNQNSYAMVSMLGAIQEIVSVNDAISEGLYLTKIAKRLVEVDYFGEKFVLTIEDRTRKPELIQNLSVNENPVTTSLNFEQQIDFLEVDKKRNPIRLFMIRRPYAVYRDGQFQGYKIMPGSNADQFKRLGFESGDIITYLNGIEFTGPGNKEYVIHQLTHSMYVDLTVIRGDQILNIKYGF